MWSLVFLFPPISRNRERQRYFATSDRKSTPNLIGSGRLFNQMSRHPRPWQENTLLQPSGGLRPTANLSSSKFVVAGFARIQADSQNPEFYANSATDISNRQRNISVNWIETQQSTGEDVRRTVWGSHES